MKYSKICPNCGTIQNYSCENSLLLAMKKNTVCKTCSSFMKAKRKGNAEYLLGTTLDVYYWLGFIMADGHISNGRLAITLAYKDRAHLEKLAKNLNIEVKDSKDMTKSTITIMDKKIFTVLCSLYNITNNKTIIPCDITSLQNENLIAFSIGFIDGDGTIQQLHNRKDFHISIKNYHTWLDNLKHMFGKSYINNAGYAVACLSNTEDCKNLKLFAIDNSLPILDRKWDIVDLNYTSKQEIAKQRINIVKQMITDNKSRKEIMNEISISKGGLSLLIQRNKL